MADLVAEDVRRLPLNRNNRFDIRAVRFLVAFTRVHNIQILHAHANSLFIAKVASLLPPYPALIWHDHSGLYAVKERPEWLFRVAVGRVSGVIAVNETMAEWSRRRLQVPADRIWYIPNFVCAPNLHGDISVLPGTAGRRIVCVANFRPQKDHLTLLRAMVLVVRQMPTAHLLLVGAFSDLDYVDRIKNEIRLCGLEQNVSLLGQRHDVSAILRECDIGVLSSASEGLPLALIEYGVAGLPAVSTNVGQCAEVLEEGRAGILVPAGGSDQLAKALLSLLQSPTQRVVLGNVFRRRVEERYSPRRIMEQICRVYETVLGSIKNRANDGGQKEWS